MYSDSIIYVLTKYSRHFSWGVIIGIRAGRFSIGPCHESFKFFPKQYRPFGYGLFTLKPSLAESDQLSIVFSESSEVVVITVFRASEFISIQVDRLTGARTRMELMIGDELGSSH
ncbi:hypothetical protein QL285_063140 [Trifolium repens]|nr:hypothetical protein QL285_063140 [Trifolium repens]